ncbi:hypothetical protein QFZ27_007251 [Inquilinus ginsengisoli]
MLTAHFALPLPLAKPFQLPNTVIASEAKQSQGPLAPALDCFVGFASSQ